jgi:hypothetical protein
MLRLLDVSDTLLGYGQSLQMMKFFADMGRILLADAETYLTWILFKDAEILAEASIPG